MFGSAESIDMKQRYRAAPMENMVKRPASGRVSFAPWRTWSNGRVRPGFIRTPRPRRPAWNAGRPGMLARLERWPVWNGGPHPSLPANSSPASGPAIARFGGQYWGALPAALP
jgi:hypothetical protein